MICKVIFELIDFFFKLIVQFLQGFNFYILYLKHFLVFIYLLFKINILIFEHVLLLDTRFVIGGTIAISKQLFFTSKHIYIRFKVFQLYLQSSAIMADFLRIETFLFLLLGIEGLRIVVIWTS